MKTISSTIYPSFALLVLASLGLLPQMLAVSPPPDGCYPGLTTAEGCNALFSLGNGQGNTALGHDALFSDTSGSFNTGVGAVALALNDADFNTAVGVAGLLLNTTGHDNTAVGVGALLKNTEGYQNTANGSFALASNTSGDFNTAVGQAALTSNTTGSYNTAIGSGALGNNTSGGNNIALGLSAGTNVKSASEVICISSGGENVSNSCYIGNIWNQPGGTQAVYVNGLGKLGALSSSQRFKDEIKPMDQASEVIYCLKPVSFRYKPEIEPSRPVGFGLIAEHVEKIDPALVMHDDNGQASSVRYDAINAMLLNEFLKEHRKNEEQGAIIARLEKQLETVTATLQKVSAQLELSKPARQTVLNNP